MDTLLQEYPKLVKELETRDCSLKIEKHREFYVVTYNGDSLHPVTNLTVALGLFDVLAKPHMN